MNSLRRLIAAALIVATAMTSLPAHAAMIGLDGDRARIAAVLQRAEVRERLAELGVGAEQAQARIAALSDAEAAELAAQFETLPAGGADVLTVALVVFLVLLVTDILGYTKIFPFTRPARN
jgi:hypothetical protein